MSTFTEKLSEQLPVLFVHIGWTQRYDGTERVLGGHKFLKDNRRKNTEYRAFARNDKREVTCGIGRGHIDVDSHIVFVARDPRDRALKVVGIYAGARISADAWPSASTKSAFLIPFWKRPLVREWPKGQGMRRWARRPSTAPGVEHASLRNLFLDLPALLEGSGTPRHGGEDGDEGEVFGVEGQQQRRLQTHRKREQKLRLAKIGEVLEANNGRLICEVRGCDFDFEKVYGDVGFGYAQVHHLNPLGKIKGKQTKNGLAQLAVVCANCHAMVHRNNECRPLKGLIRPSP